MEHLFASNGEKWDGAFDHFFNLEIGSFKILGSHLIYLVIQMLAMVAEHVRDISDLQSFTTQPTTHFVDLNS